MTLLTPLGYAYALTPPRKFSAYATASEYSNPAFSPSSIKSEISVSSSQSVLFNARPQVCTGSSRDGTSGGFRVGGARGKTQKGAL